MHDNSSTLYDAVWFAFYVELICSYTIFISIFKLKIKINRNFIQWFAFFFVFHPVWIRIDDIAEWYVLIAEETTNRETSGLVGQYDYYLQEKYFQLNFKKTWTKEEEKKQQKNKSPLLCIVPRALCALAAYATYTQKREKTTRRNKRKFLTKIRNKIDTFFYSLNW